MQVIWVICNGFVNKDKVVFWKAIRKKSLQIWNLPLVLGALRFFRIANKIDRAKLKVELEEYGRKLRLMWDFRNDERPFPCGTYRTKSTLNPRNKDTVIETFLSYLEERFLDIDIWSKRFTNLTKGECNGLYKLTDDQTMIIKGADKVSAVVVWDSIYLKEAAKQLEDKNVYEESKVILVFLSTLFFTL